MEDKELFEAWKKKDVQENKVYEKYKEKYEKLVLKQSNDIFKKIKKNVQVELVLTLLLSLVFLTAPLHILKGKEMTIYIWLFTIALTILGVISVLIYYTYLRDIKLINETSIVNSLKKKKTVLSNYIKQLNVTLLIFMPIMFYFGVYFGFTEKGKELDLYKMLKLFGVSIPILILFMWLVRKYINALYGNHLKSIQEIYQNLLEDNR